MKLISLLTRDQHIDVLTRHPNNEEAARVYTAAVGQPVSRQLVNYWRRVFIEASTKAKADRELANSRVLRTPEPGDDLGDVSFIPKVAKRILVVGDLHYPYTHPDTLPFLEHLQQEYSPDLVVQVGDETDGHAISFHDSDPNLDSAGVELERAKEGLAEFYKLFPEVLVCHSNHGSLIHRRAKAHGLPVQYIKSYREILFPDHQAPGWSWAFNWKIETPQGPVLFRHQTTGHVLDAAAAEGCNLVVGHEHGKAGCQWGATSMRLFWGAYTGCLIDHKSMAFAYGKLFPRKPIIGAMMIIHGVPVFLPMTLDEDGRWTGP